MMDNTIFFVGAGATPKAVRDAIAEVSGLKSSSISLADADYVWQDAAHYVDHTLLEWHANDGEFPFEFEVMLGGKRLADAPWPALANALKTVILVDADPVAVRYEPAASPEAVQVDWPEEYGGDGPIVGASLASLLTPHQHGLLAGMQRMGSAANWYTLGRLALAQGQSPGSFTAELRGLIDHGFVDETSVEDQKLPRLSLTAQGESALSDSAPADAVQSAQTAIESIVASVHPLLAAFADPTLDHAAIIAQLKPQPGDAAAAFHADIAAHVQSAYDQLWQDTPQIEPKPGQTVLHVHPCPAGMFGQQTPLTQPFPGGYAALGPYLIPNRIWLAWRYTEPDAPRGMAYNGLVWLDDHWAWFPKPYRVVGRIVSN